MAHRGLRRPVRSLLGRLLGSLARIRGGCFGTGNASATRCESNRDHHQVEQGAADDLRRILDLVFTTTRIGKSIDGAERVEDRFTSGGEACAVIPELRLDPLLSCRGHGVLVLTRGDRPR
jgi:hypothetical protein